MEPQSALPSSSRAFPSCRPIKKNNAGPVSPLNFFSRFNAKCGGAGWGRIAVEKRRQRGGLTKIARYFPFNFCLFRVLLRSSISGSAPAPLRVVLFADCRFDGHASGAARPCDHPIPNRYKAGRLPIFTGANQPEELVRMRHPSDRGPCPLLWPFFPKKPSLVAGDGRRRRRNVWRFPRTWRSADIGEMIDLASGFPASGPLFGPPTKLRCAAPGRRAKVFTVAQFAAYWDDEKRSLLFFFSFSARCPPATDMRRNEWINRAVGDGKRRPTEITTNGSIVHGRLPDLYRRAR